MKKSTLVSTKLLSTGEYKNIPVNYFIKNEDGNPNIKLISCEVNLPESELPEWLSPTNFTIRQVFSDGVTITELSSIKCANVDSANFVDSTHMQIRLNEKFS